ncbi:hypothetical protein K457DRAFT_1589124 [Linnemannia elongata AG-77]|uniref:Uncharacterized protein n=1 Tax=Linnemannia elongata AG-77 TaxID=1314771 RepID=A0A197JP05_9FUNG|nr:hypothetical protein K457DRAFT_1589124 [Linnemannia elongata AG-77]
MGFSFSLVSVPKSFCKVAVSLPPLSCSSSLWTTVVDSVPDPPFSVESLSVVIVTLGIMLAVAIIEGANVVLMGADVNVEEVTTPVVNAAMLAPRASAAVAGADVVAEVAAVEPSAVEAGTVVAGAEPASELAPVASEAADVAAAATAAAVAAEVPKSPAGLAAASLPVVEYMDKGDEWYGAELSPVVKKLSWVLDAIGAQIQQRARG